MDSFSFKFDGKELAPVKGVVGNNGKYHLPGESWLIEEHFGKAFFQVFRTREYNVWYSHFEAVKDFELCIRVDSPLLLFHAQLNGDIHCFCNEVELGCREGQYEMIHVPYVDAFAKLGRGRNYDSFIIIFRPAFFHAYTGSSQQLANFLDGVGKNRITRLFNSAGFLSPSMEDGIRSILSYKGELSNRFIECRVNELTILLIHQLNMSGKIPEPDPLEIQKAEEVKKIISGDLSRLYKVETLAKKVHTTEQKLQATFKQLYGTTVGKFSRELHLKKAHELLTDQSGLRETLLSIALSVGYNDVANFANAFKQHFGYPPGAINKRGRIK